MLWNAFGEANNYGILKGHKGAILQVEWSRDSTKVYSCSADQTIAVWDIETGEIIKRGRGHKSIVNSLSLSKRGQEMACSVGDDGAIKVWDTRQRNPVKSFDGKYPLLSCSFSRDGDLIFAAGIENEIKVFLIFIQAWDLRTDSISYALFGHQDTVTGIVKLK